ncbi:kinesin [Ophiocordyceps sinensis CO18]|uniref:Kinesin n=1 Tax=Ophiocordyceps sinensis (strain Co18 / CGMCC 3.14243) TaxID=911162 RepID=T5AFC3_OPHSC|nr:kinesin [Ophiocordyceps sinensis CO18]
MDRGGNVRVVVRVRAFLQRGKPTLTLFSPFRPPPQSRQASHPIDDDETDSSPELQRKARCLIHMDPITQVTTLLAPDDQDGSGMKQLLKSRKVYEDKTFTFDSSFWSHDTADKHYVPRARLRRARMPRARPAIACDPCPSALFLGTPSTRASQMPMANVEIRRTRCGASLERLRLLPPASAKHVLEARDPWRL